MLSEKGEIDMNNNTKFQWIDNDTDVSEILKKCPKHIHKMIEEMEQADLEEKKWNRQTLKIMLVFSMQFQTILRLQQKC